MTFSTAINLFVTVSHSDSMSPFGINFIIFIHPARSFSESPDILNTNQNRSSSAIRVLLRDCPCWNTISQKGSANSSGCTFAAFHTVGHISSPTNHMLLYLVTFLFCSLKGLLCLRHVFILGRNVFNPLLEKCWFIVSGAVVCGLRWTLKASSDKVASKYKAANTN